MISAIRPSPDYNVQNEAEFRRQVQEADGKNLKSDAAFSSFIMLDETDGSAQRITLVSGVLTVTPV